MQNEIRMLFSGLLAFIGLALVSSAMAQGGGIPRTSSGHPDLSGTYDVSTLTPLNRPEEFGEKVFLTDDEAAGIAARELARNIERQ